MAIQAFFLSTLVMMALGIGLIDLCRFLVPYKPLLLGPYARPLVCYFGALYLNLFAVFYLASRHLFLKDTGRKLAHLEKQFRVTSPSGSASDLSVRSDVVNPFEG